MKHEQDVVIERVAETLRTSERIDPSFDARVMAAVRALPAPRRRLSLWQWLVQPKLMPVSPIGGVAFGGAMAALLVVFAVRGEPGTGDAAPNQTVASAQDQQLIAVNNAPKLTTVVVGRAVQFALLDPTAKQVAVVGDFNDWDPDSTLMVRTPRGEWTITVPMPTGRYTYNFLIDGERWVADPAMPAGPRDEFLGVPSSVLSVGDGIR